MKVNKDWALCQVILLLILLFFIWGDIMGFINSFNVLVSLYFIENGGFYEKTRIYTC